MMSMMSSLIPSRAISRLPITDLNHVQSMEAIFLALILWWRRFDYAMTDCGTSPPFIAALHKIIVWRRGSWPREVGINMFEGLIIGGGRPFPSSRNGCAKEGKET